jgi:hypothetical protein
MCQTTCPHPSDKRDKFLTDDIDHKSTFSIVENFLSNKTNSLNSLANNPIKRFFLPNNQPRYKNPHPSKPGYLHEATTPILFQLQVCRQQLPNFFQFLFSRLLYSILLYFYVAHGPEFARRRAILTRTEFGGTLPSERPLNGIPNRALRRKNKRHVTLHFSKGDWHALINYRTMRNPVTSISFQFRRTSEGKLGEMLFLLVYWCIPLSFGFLEMA